MVDSPVLIRSSLFTPDNVADARLLQGLEGSAPPHFCRSPVLVLVLASLFHCGKCLKLLGGLVSIGLVKTM